MGLNAFLTNAGDTFWAPSFWLPSNLTWSDLNREGISYPNVYHIGYSVCFSLVIVLIRILFEKYIFMPIGIAKGLRVTKFNIEQNPILEKAHLSTGRSRNSLSHSKIQGLAKQLDWSERQVERWMRQRKQNDKPPALVKLTECGWRATYYLFAFIYGLVVLYNKPFFWDINKAWEGYPHQSTPWELNLYYGFQLSCYWSMLFSQFVDVKRKDFMEMFIHHIATIFLISLSWMCNMVRTGSLILICHDCADIFLESAKIFKYLHWQKLCDICFGIFFLVWVATRLTILPFYLTENILISCHQHFPTFPAFNVLKGLIIVLLVLHTVWTYFILKILYRAMLSGKTEKDSRSSSSENSSDENSDGAPLANEH